MKKQIIGCVTICILISTSISCVTNDNSKRSKTRTNANTSAEQFVPTWESLSKHNPVPEWFRDAKFGIYFHWGVYSVPAYGSEWYPRNMHFKNSREYKHHLKKYGDPAEFGYHDFVPMFKADKFDADAWADLFKKAGARFAGPVAEHHDGFSMWDSKVNPWNVGEKGPERDITGELEKAIRERGMKFIATFHHARNLQRYTKLWPEEKRFGHSHYPMVKGWPTASDDPELRILYGNIPEKQFLENWKGKLAEVIDNYQPDFIWFDSWLNQIPEKTRQEFCAYYLNQAEKWDKNVLIVRKQNDLPLDFSILDLEKGRMNKLTDFCWLTDDTISRGSWCYTENLRIKPTSEVLHGLIDIVSKNGQLLLNISPKADGSIPDDQKKVLLEMGDWLEKYGECIYGTRPWVVFGEGPTRLKRGGGFVNRHGKLKYSEKDIRFTTKGNVLYAIFMGQPKKEVCITSLAEDSGMFAGNVKEVSLLNSNRKLDFSHKDDGLHIIFPKDLPSEFAIPVKITGLKIEGFEYEPRVRLKETKGILNADKAILHGITIKLENQDDGKSSIGFWNDTSEWVSWNVQFDTAGTYEIRGRIAAPKASACKINIGDKTTTCRISPTGSWDTFKTVRLGTVKIDKPETLKIKVMTVPEKWTAVNISQLELTPIK